MTVSFWWSVAFVLGVAVDKFQIPGNLNEVRIRTHTNHDIPTNKKFNLSSLGVSFVFRPNLDLIPSSHTSDTHNYHPIIPSFIPLISTFSHCKPSKKARLSINLLAFPCPAKWIGR